MVLDHPRLHSGNKGGGGAVDPLTAPHGIVLANPVGTSAGAPAALPPRQPR